jgi:hypothetical protein
MLEVDDHRVFCDDRCRQAVRRFKARSGRVLEEPGVANYTRIILVDPDELEVASVTVSSRAAAWLTRRGVVGGPAPNGASVAGTTT